MATRAKEGQNGWTENELLHVRGGVGAKDCWFKEMSKGSTVSNNKAKKGTGTSKGKKQEQCQRSYASDRVDDDSTSGNIRQSNVTQNDTENGPVPMDEDGVESYETGFFLAAIRHREPVRHS